MCNLTAQHGDTSVFKVVPGPRGGAERDGYLRKNHPQLFVTPINALRHVLCNLQQSLGVRQMV